MKSRILICLVLATSQLPAQTPHPHLHNRAIDFPDVPGYLTLVCDLHQHTVFSDGSVWPNIRIAEALRDSVDVISLTEHLEYQPHEKDMPNPDRNRAYQLAEQYARPYDLIAVAGSEITRDMPLGHHNAIFIEDANKLLLEDPMEVFREANRQGAFVFWNHPNWIGQRRDAVATIEDVHKDLISQDMLHGIEVVNDLTYSDKALEIAIEYGLTIMATSDIHLLIDWQFDLANGGHRPVTLVFAEERTPESIREALFAGRTVAWFRNTLVGLEQNILPLLDASVEVLEAEYIGTSTVLEVTVRNHSDADLFLLNRSDYRFYDKADVVILHGMSDSKLQVMTIDELEALEMRFEVLNAVTAPGKHAEIAVNVEVGR